MITVTKSAPSLTCYEGLKDPSLAAYVAQLYTCIADALVKTPETLYTVLCTTLAERIPLNGCSVSVMQEIDDTSNRSSTMQDWRMEEQNEHGVRTHAGSAGFQMPQQKKHVTIEEALNAAEERLIATLNRNGRDKFGVALHWLLLGTSGMAICIYRVGSASSKPKDFTSKEIALLDTLAPYLSRILDLDVTFKVRASGYEFFSRRTIEIADQHGLTTTEYRILHQIVSGSDNASIARNMGVSIATVKTHITHILQKTACRNRNALLGRYFSSIEALAL